MWQRPTRPTKLTSFSESARDLHDYKRLVKKGPRQRDRLFTAVDLFIWREGLSGIQWRSSVTQNAVRPVQPAQPVKLDVLGMLGGLLY